MEEEKSVVEPVLEESWLCKDLESQAMTYAVSHLVPQHLQEVRQRKEELIVTTMAAGTFARETERVKKLAIAAVMAAEQQLGYERMALR